MKNLILPAVYLILVLVFVVYFSIAYYTWDCNRLKISWLKYGYAPMRCIK